MNSRRNNNTYIDKKVDTLTKARPIGEKKTSRPDEPIPISGWGHLDVTFGSLYKLRRKTRSASLLPRFMEEQAEATVGLQQSIGHLFQDKVAARGSGQALQQSHVRGWNQIGSLGGKGLAKGGKRCNMVSNVKARLDVGLSGFKDGLSKANVSVALPGYASLPLNIRSVIPITLSRASKNVLSRYTASHVIKGAAYVATETPGGNFEDKQRIPGRSQ